jgi:hypothetical protein
MENAVEIQEQPKDRWRDVQCDEERCTEREAMEANEEKREWAKVEREEKRKIPL